jgi:hypothetical protein
MEPSSRIVQPRGDGHWEVKAPRVTGTMPVLLGQAVFELGWTLMADSSNDPIGFHLAKLLDQHLLRNHGNRGE